MNTETILTIVTWFFAAASLCMVGGAILETIKDRADCLAREQGARRLATGAR